MGNTRAGLHTQLVEYVKENKNDDDDDGGTVIDRKLIIFNNINTNIRFNYGAATADATAAIVVIFPLAVAVLRAFMCLRTLPFRPTTGPQKLKQAKLGQFSIFLIRNRTIVCLN